MTVEADIATAGRNPQTFEEAGRLVKHVESLFMPMGLRGVVGGFHG